MDKDFTDPKLIHRARELRQDRPEAEALLWSRLRGQHLGHKFRRQHPIGPFIVDFACVPARLVVEIDGKSHRDCQAEDDERTETLERLGWRVVRYSDLDVLNKLDAVVSDIARNLPPAAPTYALSDGSKWEGEAPAEPRRVSVAERLCGAFSAPTPQGRPCGPRLGGSLALPEDLPRTKMIRQTVPNLPRWGRD